MVLWWSAGEIVAAAFASGGGLVLSVAFWRWLMYERPVDPDVWPVAGRSLGVAVAVLAAAAVTEVLLPRWETR